MLWVLEISGADKDELYIVVGSEVEDEVELLDVEVERVDGTLEILGTTLEVLAARLEVLEAALSNTLPI